MRHCLQKDVALAIGMSEQVFSNKMNGLRSFSAKDYKALADFFNTSVDYLMGRNLAEGTGAGGAIVLLSRHEAAVMA